MRVSRCVAKTRSEAGQNPNLWIGSLAIYAALMVLLVLTLVLAYVPLGAWNAATSYAIAGAKALLVALVFMRLRNSPTIIRLAVLAGVVWLATLYALTFTDFPFRQQGERIHEPLAAHGQGAAVLIAR